MSGGQTVGFVGLGAMGLPIAERLQQAGHQLLVHDVRPSAADPLVSRGAERAASIRELADRAGVVLVSLPLPQIIREVALGADGLLGGGAIKTYVDLSTTGPATAEEVAAQLTQAGVEVVDAPLSGGPAGARAGKLTAMIAGPDAAIARVRPLLDAFTSRQFVVGSEPGQGQSAKVINNLMSACAIAITAEAMLLGVRAGLDPATLLEVVNTSSGANNAAADKFPKQVLTRNFNHGFRMELMAKDVKLAVDEARRRSVPMPLGSLVSELWQIADPELLGEDCTAIVRMFEQWAHAEIVAQP
jgi:2-hydroxy-3-oxopropionate reductase